MNKYYQVKLTLEGNEEQITHTLLTIARNMQVQQHYLPGQAIYIDARGYEDILIDSQLEEI